jgi:hypothetical protein
LSEKDCGKRWIPNALDDELEMLTCRADSA